MRKVKIKNQNQNRTRVQEKAVCLVKAMPMSMKKRLKKKKKPVYSSLPNGATKPEYTLESSYDYSSSFTSDDYFPQSDPEEAESKA